MKFREKGHTHGDILRRPIDMAAEAAGQGFPVKIQAKRGFGVILSVKRLRWQNGS